MTREEYFRRLQAPFDWKLEPEEEEVAVRMAKQHGGQVVMKAWHAFQKENPLRTFAEFESRFEEYRHAADPMPSLTEMFQEQLRKQKAAMVSWNKP